MMGERPLSQAQKDMLSEARRLIEGEEQHASKFNHGIYTLQKERMGFQWYITVLDTATTLYQDSRRGGVRGIYPGFARLGVCNELGELITSQTSRLIA
jgi:hypothetical protein